MAGSLRPQQVPVINALVAPTEQELEQARKVVGLFVADPDLEPLRLMGECWTCPI